MAATLWRLLVSIPERFPSNMPKVWESLLLVDDHGHTSLAMLALRAVEPQRSRAIDENGVCGSHDGVGCDWHEARVKTSGVGEGVYGVAWLVEGGLCDGVVCWCELELYHISNGCYQIVWGVREGSI